MFCNVCHIDRPSVCQSCVDEMRANHRELAEMMAEDAHLPVRTALQEAVLRAAVAWRCDHNLDELQALVKLDATVDALLAAEPAWGEK